MVSPCDILPVNICLLGHSCVFFHFLFSGLQTKNVDTGYVVGKLMSHFNPLVQDYGEFLALKGTFNIPIVRYP